MDLGMNDTLNWGYMHCMIAASREMSDEPEKFQTSAFRKKRGRFIFRTIILHSLFTSALTVHLPKRHKYLKNDIRQPYFQAKCILQIAWESHFYAQARRRVQRRAFSGDSFDVLTLCHFIHWQEKTERPAIASGIENIFVNHWFIK